MKKKILIPIIFLLFTAFVIIFTSYFVSAETIYVGTNQEYTNIQDAINAANESDSIYVYRGTYSENILIAKTLTITGEGSDICTISYSSDHTLKITANDVSLSGFKIQNIASSYYCVYLSSTTGCQISNNIIRNGGHGIYLGSSDENSIYSNTIENNNVGIYLSNSDNNIIRENDISNNNQNGIFCFSTSSGNTFYLNDFGNNDGNAYDLSTNNWDYNSQGNYWDDYNDYDSNADGVGDNPYGIEGGDNLDNYPLGDFLSANQKPNAFIESITPNPATEGNKITFYGRGTDDGAIVNWEWKSSIDGFLSNSKNYEISSLSVGTHYISYRVQDDNGEWSSYAYKTLILNPKNDIPLSFILSPSDTITKEYGESISFQGDYSDDGQIVEYSWHSSLDGVISSSLEFTKSDLSAGQHDIFFKVKDNYNQWSNEARVRVIILSPTENNAAFVDTGGPYTGFVNESISFDASGSYDPDEEDIITKYLWDFGDNTTSEGKKVDHIYLKKGNYTITLTLTDSNDLESSKESYANITVKNNSNNNQEEKKDTPAFELVIFIIAIATIAFFIKKRSA